MKEIQIRRKEKTHSYLPTQVVADARKKLGSIYVSRSPLRGLTRDEERKYLPQMLGISADHPDFERHARKFWADFSIDVPSDGVVLNITCNEKGEPHNVDDWVKYKWAQKHRFVAGSFDEMRKDPTTAYYIYNPEVETQRTNSKLQDKKVAYKELIRLSTDVNAMSRVLRILGTSNPDSLSSEQKENQLAVLLEANPQRFIAVATDKNLETRDFIFQLVGNNILRHIGSAYLYMDETVGDTLDEAVSYVNNKRNSKVVAEMKAKLKEFSGDTTED
jgi:hypothetical protein